MTMTFDEERASCVGGSDLPHLLQMPPYGCRRRLWYDKARVPADFPFTGNPNTERGLACEPFAAHDFLREYEALTFYVVADGVPVRSGEAVPFRRLNDAESPMIACHADRLVRARSKIEPYSDVPTAFQRKSRGPEGVLEIKCPSARAYYTGRGSVDPPNEGKIQANYCAGVWGVGTCYVQWFSTDAWRSRFWQFPFDPQMFTDCVNAAVDFWKTLDLSEPPYERLPEDDRRCNSCPWRGRCKGLDLDAEQGETPVDIGGPRLLDLGIPMDQVERLALGYVAAKAVRDQADEAFEITKARLIELFPGPGKVETPAALITYSESFRKGYVREVKPTTVRTLRVKPAKEEPDVTFDTE